MKIQLLHGTFSIPGRTKSWEVKIIVRKGENPERALAFAYLVHAATLTLTSYVVLRTRNYLPSLANNYTVVEYSVLTSLNDVYINDINIINGHEQLARAKVREIRKTIRDTTAILAAERN